MDLAPNNQKLLICLKTKPNKTNLLPINFWTTLSIYIYVYIHTHTEKSF